MKNKKFFIILLLIGILSISIVNAVEPGPIFKKPWELLRTIMGKGPLEGADLLTLIKIVFGMIIIIGVYFGGEKLNLFNKNARIGIGIGLALLTVFGLTNELLLAIAGSYIIVIAFALMYALIILVLWVILKKIPNTRFWCVIKIMGLMLLIFLISWYTSSLEKAAELFVTNSGGGSTWV